MWGNWRTAGSSKATGLSWGRKEIGLGVFAFIRVKIDSHSEAEAEAFTREVTALAEVVACCSIAGDADFLLQVVARDLDAYSEFAMNVMSVESPAAHS